MLESINSKTKLPLTRSFLKVFGKNEFHIDIKDFRTLVYEYEKSVNRLRFYVFLGNKKRENKRFKLNEEDTETYLYLLDALFIKPFFKPDKDIFKTIQESSLQELLTRSAHAPTFDKINYVNSSTEITIEQNIFRHKMLIALHKELYSFFKLANHIKKIILEPKLNLYKFNRTDADLIGLYQTINNMMIYSGKRFYKHTIFSMCKNISDLVAFEVLSEFRVRPAIERRVLVKECVVCKALIWRDEKKSDYLFNKSKSCSKRCRNKLSLSKKPIDYSKNLMKKRRAEGKK